MGGFLTTSIDLTGFLLYKLQSQNSFTLILELFFPNSPSSLIPETGRVVTPMAGNVGVKELGDCKPTPVDPVTKSSEGVFGLFFKFGVGLEGR